MSESELHAILNEIKNKGQVPDGVDSKQGKEDYTKIIDSFNNLSKDDKIDKLNDKNKQEFDGNDDKAKPSVFDKIKRIFKNNL